MSVADEIANFVVGLKYEDLPEKVVEKAKQSLMDTLGVTVAARDGSACKIIRNIVEEIGGKSESTIIGSSKNVPSQNAALANCVMARYLDFNDVHMLSGHPSNTIPTVLAVGEKVHATGEEIVTNITLGYELHSRWHAALPDEMQPHWGWHHAMVGSFTAPMVAGKLLDLDENQIANALAISLIGHGPSLGIVDSGDVPYSMMKSIMPALPARDGILAALLAKRGWTGNKERLFEHPRGFQLIVRACAPSKAFDEELLYSTKPMGGERWQILRTLVKPYAAEASLQPILIALMRLIEEHNILPKDVKEITIHTYEGPGPLGHLFDPSKRYPENKETADHSGPFVIASAIKDHAVGPDQYTDENIRNPTIRKLIDKVKAVEQPELREKKGAIVEVETMDGGKYRDEEYSPWLLSEEFIESKFKQCTSGLIEEDRIGEIINVIYNLENLDGIVELSSLFV